MSETGDDTKKDDLTRNGVNVGAVIVVFACVWLVFDNLALALLFALVFAGGAEAAQRASKKE